MFCISVSYKRTPLTVRQQFSFSQEEQKSFLSELKEKGKITGGIIVSTCNRSEIYFTGDRKQMEDVETAWSAFKGVKKDTIKKYGLYYSDITAIRHLFKVVCGLDSMVLGEDEILRQVKEAYLSAEDNGTISGELNIIFQDAFHCAKTSKSATRLSNTPVSVGTLTANVIADYLGKCHEKEGRVLVIGATGKIGSIVAKDLMAKGISVIGTGRRHHQAGELFMPGMNVEWLDFDKRYDILSKVQAVVSATASPHYTLTREEFQKQAGKREYLLIDLAVPCDIDKEISEIDGVSLLDIDYFNMLSKENSNIKLGELDKVKSILQEHLDVLLKKLYLREFKMKMGKKYEEQRLLDMIFYLKEVLDSQQFLDVLEKIYLHEK